MSAPPFAEVRSWLWVSLGIAGVMLVGVTVAAYFLPASPFEGSFSLITGEYSNGSHFRSDTTNVAYIFTRNFIVLALHYCCCLVGVIISREHKPLPEGHWAARFHRPLPKWMGDLALAYAMTATLASIAIQSTGLGFVLADISAYTQIAPWQMVALILPHAIPELVGVFLPLGLFLVQSFRHDLKPLRGWANFSLVIALPLIILSAIIEITLTPHLVEWRIDSTSLSAY